MRIRPSSRIVKPAEGYEAAAQRTGASLRAVEAQTRPNLDPRGCVLVPLG